MNDERTHDGEPRTEGALLLAALREAADAWTARIRACSGDGDTTCGVCPICLTVAHVARDHPDLVQRLAEAASALGAAISAAGENYRAGRPEPPPSGDAPDGDAPGHRPGGRRPVQHITVTD